MDFQWPDQGSDNPDASIPHSVVVKKSVNLLIQDSVLKQSQSVLQKGKQGRETEVWAQKKENIKYLFVFVGIYDELSQHVLMCQLVSKCTWLHFDMLGP